MELKRVRVRTAGHIGQILVRQRAVVGHPSFSQAALSQATPRDEVAIVLDGPGHGRSAELEGRNANYVGGDISSRALRGLQAIFRPRLAVVPYATPDPAVFLCSSAPQGRGVHGIFGHLAARVVLRRVFDRRLDRYVGGRAPDRARSGVPIRYAGKGRCYFRR